MSLVTLTGLPTSGDTPMLASHVRTPVQQLADEINGNLDNSNIAANAAIAGSKIATGGISATQLASDSVTEAKIADGAVTAGKIGSGAVTEAKLGAGAVTADKIGSSAVASAKIADGAITTAKIADNAVTAAKIADDSIDSNDKISSSVTKTQVVSIPLISPGGALSGSAGGFITLNDANDWISGYWRVPADISGTTIIVTLLYSSSNSNAISGTFSMLANSDGGAETWNISNSESVNVTPSAGSKYLEHTLYNSNNANITAGKTICVEFKRTDATDSISVRAIFITYTQKIKG